jgi:hypothetical protein
MTLTTDHFQELCWLYAGWTAVADARTQQENRAGWHSFFEWSAQERAMQADPGQEQHVEQTQTL